MVYGKTTNSDRARKNQRKSAKLAAEALFIASYAVLPFNELLQHYGMERLTEEIWSFLEMPLANQKLSPETKWNPAKRKWQ
jgi:hypothetical protein